MDLVRSDKRLFDRINQIAVVCSAFLLCLMAVHIVVDVGASYIFGLPLKGTVEMVSRYYMVAIVFLPLPFVQSADKHIIAGIFTDHAPHSVRAAFRCIALILMCVFGVLLAWRCGIEAMRMTELNEQIQTARYFIPAWPSRWIPVLAGALIAIQSILSLWRLFTEYFSGAAPSEYDERGTQGEAQSKPADSLRSRVRVAL